MGSYIEEIEKNAAKCNTNKENLLNRFKAIVEVPNRKGIEDWKKEEIQLSPSEEVMTNSAYTEHAIQLLEYLDKKHDTAKGKLSN